MSEQAEKDPATILEEAADLLLIRGVRRDGRYGVAGGPRCTVGALEEVVGPGTVSQVRDRMWPAKRALIWHLQAEGHSGVICDWNDSSSDDFEVIDTLRLVAKQLRNGE